MTPDYLICMPVAPEELSVWKRLFPDVYDHTIQKAFLLFAQPETARELEAYQREHPDLRVQVQDRLPRQLWEFAPLLEAKDRARDLLVLFPGILPPRAWDLRLAWAAHQDDGLAVVSPLSEMAEIFSPSTESSALKDLDLESANSVLYTIGDRISHESPLGLPFAAYIRRDLTAGTSPQHLPQKEEDLYAGSLAHARFLYDHGHSTAICDNLYVDFEPTEAIRSFRNGLEKTDNTELLKFERRHPLLRVRYRLKNDQDITANPPDATLPGIDTLPVQLHVMHSWGGGLNKWVEDFCRSDTARQNMILKSIGSNGSYGERLALYAHVDHIDPVAVWDLSRPIRATSLHHLQYARVLDEVVDRFDVKALLVSSFIGHSLDILDAPVPTAVVCHDYFPHCPFIFTMRKELCPGCNEAEFKNCLATNPHREIFPGLTDRHWTKLRRAYMDKIRSRNIPLVVPTKTVAERLKTLEQGFDTLTFRHIPHGMDTAPFVPVAPRVEGRPQLVVLGELLPQKGLELLRSTLSRITVHFDVHLVGCGVMARDLDREDNVSTVPRYDLSELPDILEEIGPCAALLLSTWPETFSYTLSEVTAMAIPPVASRLGAFAERIRDGETGILFEPDPDGLLQAVDRIRTDPDLLYRIHSRLKGMGHTTLEEMVAAYHDLLPLSQYSSASYFQGRKGHRDRYGRPKIMDSTYYDHDQPFIYGLERFCSFAGTKIGSSPRIRSRLLRRFLQKTIWASYHMIDRVTSLRRR